MEGRLYYIDYYITYTNFMNRYLEKIASSKLEATVKTINSGSTILSRMAGAGIQDLGRAAKKTASKLKGYAKDATGVTHLEYVQNQLDLKPNDWKSLVDKKTFALDKGGYRNFLRAAKKVNLNPKAMGKEQHRIWVKKQKRYWGGYGADSARYKQLKGLAITGGTAYGVAKGANRIYNKVNEMRAQPQSQYSPNYY